MSDPVPTQDLALVLVRSDAQFHENMAADVEKAGDPIGMADAHRLAASWLEALADAMAAR